MLPQFVDGILLPEGHFACFTNGFSMALLSILSFDGSVSRAVDVLGSCCSIPGTHILVVSLFIRIEPAPHSGPFLSPPGFPLESQVFFAAFKGKDVGCLRGAVSVAVLTKYDFFSTFLGMPGNVLVNTSKPTWRVLGPYPSFGRDARYRD